MSSAVDFKYPGVRSINEVARQMSTTKYEVVNLLNSALSKIAVSLCEKVERGVFDD